MAIDDKKPQQQQQGGIDSAVSDIPPKKNVKKESGFKHTPEEGSTKEWCESFYSVGDIVSGICHVCGVYVIDSTVKVKGVYCVKCGNGVGG